MDETIHDRLRIARERAGYRSASEAARHFGWKDSTYRHHENGTRGIKAPDIKQYSRAYRVPVDWLALGKRPGTVIVPLVGSIGPGGEVMRSSDERLAEGIQGPPDVPAGAEAVKVLGDSLYPRYFDGDIIFYKQPVPAGQVDGQECIVKLRDGRQLVRILHMLNGVVTLESVNASPIHDAAIEWASPVVWVKRA